ncbi:hypothetical protein AK812_SmicGene22394 [Symbiodinium microadriaticum]|uniref:Uncharacterized protein n=1 Tax=Symbiodinium microadriaticum TaxID=2951 RepID=A0A1Q9DJZ1_SYMMI|nr:hypothetical protein AK812_SmicGene22394 [Symbiodinium microadriaticum]CAE7949407.1 unnamed protein product [Symbiodinium sp. KB8]
MSSLTEAGLGKLCYDLLRENAELRKMTNSYQLHVLMLYQGKNISDASIGMSTDAEDTGLAALDGGANQKVTSV